MSHSSKLNQKLLIIPPPPIVVPFTSMHFSLKIHILKLTYIHIGYIYIFSLLILKPTDLDKFLPGFAVFTHLAFKNNKPTYIVSIHDYRLINTLE